MRWVKERWSEGEGEGEGEGEWYHYGGGGEEEVMDRFLGWLVEGVHIKKTKEVHLLSKCKRRILLK